MQATHHYASIHAAAIEEAASWPAYPAPAVTWPPVKPEHPVDADIEAWTDFASAEVAAAAAAPPPAPAWAAAHTREVLDDLQVPLDDVAIFTNPFADPDEDVPVAVGSTVLIDGLKAKPELNRTVGFVQEDRGERWAVSCAGAIKTGLMLPSEPRKPKVLALKPVNLTPVKPSFAAASSAGRGGGGVTQPGGSPRAVHANSGMTLSWLANMALGASNRNAVSAKLTALLALPDAEQQVEKGAALLEAWMTGADYDELMDLISKEVAHLAAAAKMQYASATPSIRSKLESLRNTMTTFKGNQVDYYNPENSFLSKVFQKKLGIPITLAVVAIAVGRELGIALQPINFPRHFLLKCKLENETELIMDAFKGEILTREENAQIHGYSHDKYYVATSSVEVLLRMCRNLLAMEQGLPVSGRVSAADLMIAIDPTANDVESCLRIRLTRAVLLVNNVYKPEAAGLEFGWVLRNVPRSTVDAIFPQMDSAMATCQMKHFKDCHAKHTRYVDTMRRSEHPWHTDPDAPFVGCICRHRKYGYTCLVAGWDPTCMMTEEWQEQMSVAKLKRGANQPFHDALCSDGSSRYAAFDSLEIIRGDALNPFLPSLLAKIHASQVARYFTHYDPSRQAFAMNGAMQQRYPDDTMASTSAE